MTVHYLARGESVAHVIPASVRDAMRVGGRAKTVCLRCGEKLKPSGSWGTRLPSEALWDGVTLCEKARESDE